MARVVLQGQTRFPLTSLSSGDYTGESICYVTDLPGEEVELGSIPAGTWIHAYNPDEVTLEQAYADLRKDRVNG